MSEGGPPSLNLDKKRPLCPLVQHRASMSTRPRLVASSTILAERVKVSIKGLRRMDSAQRRARCAGARRHVAAEAGNRVARSGALRRCTGMGAKPRAPRLAGFGFVMVPYRSLPLGPRSCDLRSITPLSQKCAYQRQPASEEPRVLEVARLKSDETD